MKVGCIVWFCLGILISGGVKGQLQIVDTIAYNSWKRIENPQLSVDGKWFLYRVSLFEPGNEKREPAPYRLRNTFTGKEYVFENAESFQFFDHGRWLMFRKSAPAPEKQDSVILFDLSREKYHFLDREVNVYPETNLMIWLEPYAQETGMKGFSKLRYLYAGRQDTATLEGIGTYRLYEGGRSLVCLRKEGNQEVLCYGRLGGKLQTIAVFGEDGIGNAPESFRLEAGSTGGTFQVDDTLIYGFSLQNNNCRVLCNLNDYQPPVGCRWAINRLQLPAHRAYAIIEAVPEVAHRIAENKKGGKPSFELELWKWDDEIVQSRQRKNHCKYKRNLPQYILRFDSRQPVEVLPAGFDALILPPGSDDTVALALDKQPYWKSADWKSSDYTDVYAVNLINGRRRLILSSTIWRPLWSPDGNAALLYDSEGKHWCLFDPRTGKLAVPDVGYPVFNEMHDQPCPANPYGLAGWTPAGNPVVYDRYDLWELPLSGQEKPRMLTDGYGRKNHLVLRLLKDPMPSERLDLQKELLLKGVEEDSGDQGIWGLQSSGKLKEKMRGPYAIRMYASSEDGRYYLWTQESFREFRDFWFSDAGFRHPRRLTEANPQQKQYAWGRSRMVKWMRADGEINQGVLYLPEDYDSTRTWPVLVQFYETHTDALHTYFIPSLSRGMLDIPTCVSRGYVVFMPDVHFRVGEPGQSSYEAVVSGTEMLIRTGIADPQRIALQGHSWSGCQGAYLVGQTSLFRCAILGAAVVDMVSAYGGIRKGNGQPRMFMYEETQSRMGKSIWEDPEAYIRNSPLFYADRITTPLLLFHCDADEAVPYSQGMEFYFAMRRLQKPAWLLNYKGEGHFLSHREAMKDWTQRMLQFLDHYLAGQPEPLWMKEGITLDERKTDLKLRIP